MTSIAQDLKKLQSIIDISLNNYIQQKINISYNNTLYDFNLKNSRLSLNSINDYSEELHRTGRTIIKYFSNEETQRIKNFLYTKFQLKGHPFSNIKNITYTNQTHGTFWCFNPATIKEEHIRILLKDEGILHIIQNYLKTVPKLASVMNWKSKLSYNTESYKNTNAQAFHQDWTWVSFVKIFIYLNDVNEKNACHRFIQNSFKNFPNTLKKSNYKPGNRISDAKIKDYFGKDCIENITGKAGTIIIEDTRNFHSGSLCIEGERDLYEITYNGGHYPNKNKEITIAVDLLKKIEPKFYQKYPDILS